VGFGWDGGRGYHVMNNTGQQQRSLGQVLRVSSRQQQTRSHLHTDWAACHVLGSQSCDGAEKNQEQALAVHGGHGTPHSKGG
jgi:hypothetical protein